jgi:Tol biopolymer transport system component
MTANTDGSGTPQVLSTKRLPDFFSNEGPSWSPDGRVIATGAGTAGVHNALVIEVPADGGPERNITSARWNYVARVLWLPDSTGLILDAYANPLSPGTQLWFLSYPEGAADRITNDLNGYGTFSLGITKDATTIVTVQEDFSGPIFSIAPGEDPSHERGISSGKYDGMVGFSVTQNGRIVFCDHTADTNDIWIMNEDGGGRKQLTNDQFMKVAPKVSPNDRFIAYATDRAGGTIWRIDIDGNNPKQLTPDNGQDDNPVFSPDGQWIIFNSLRSGNNILWKVSADGGTPVQLTDKVSWRPAVSPDGKSIACFFLDDAGKMKLGILPVEGGNFEKSLDLPGSVLTDDLMWSPDGKSITLIDQRNPSNIVNQPITGGPWKPLTSFKTERIYNFAWSRDGKQLVYSRGPFVDDVLLIKDFR